MLSFPSQLLVGASVHTRPDDKTRTAGLVAAGVDVIVVDSSQGDSTYQKEMVQFIKANHPEVQVVVCSLMAAGVGLNLQAEMRSCYPLLSIQLRLDIRVLWAA